MFFWDTVYMNLIILIKLTVEHTLISFVDFDIIRQNFYTASNLKHLFHNIHPKQIVS